MSYCDSVLKLMLMLLLQLAAATVTAGEGRQINYLVTASSHFTPGIPYRIGLTSIGSNIAEAKARIQSVRVGKKFDSLRSLGSADSVGDSSSTLTVNVDESLNLDPSGEYRLVVNFTNSEGVEFGNSTSLRLRKSKAHILVQTDKAVYQPGHLVKYRVLALDESMRPQTADFRISIRDSRRNLIDFVQSNASSRAADRSSIAEGEFRLSHLVNEGTWRIEIVTGNGRTSKTFSVRKYTLPKFELTLSTPQFVFVNDSEFRVNVSVFYTNGKPVPGTLKVKLGPSNPCRSCKPKYDSQLEFDIRTTSSNGSVTLPFNLDRWREEVLIESGAKWSTWYSTFSASAEVQFTERFTGEKKSASRQFKIYKSAYKIELDTPKTEFFIPGFPINIKLSLSRPNGAEFSGRALDKMEIRMHYNRRGKAQQKLLFSGTVQDSADMTLIAQVPTLADYTELTIKAEVFTDPNKQASVTVQPYVAVTDAYVRGRVEVKEDAVTFKLNKNGDINRMVTATIVSNRLQQWSEDISGDSELMATFTADKSQLTQSVTFVGFGVAPTGEIVAAAVEHKFNDFLDNVTLTSNLTDNTGEPQQHVAVGVLARPNSIVFITGIDHSVNLVATGQDILRQTILDRLGNGVGVVAYRRGWRPTAAVVTTATILNENQLVLMSDGFYHTEPQRMSPRLATNTAYKGRMSSPMPEYSTDGVEAPPQAKSQVRKFFPETMLWQAVQTDAAGLGRHVTRLPDTITSWDVTAFALAADSPIQTMESPLKLKTHKSFFVRPVLPVSVVFGEEFILKVLVFNYVSQSASVTVTLKTANVEFDADAVDGHRLVRRTPEEVTVTLEAGGHSMAAFKLTPRSQSFVLDAAGARPPALDIVVIGNVTLGEYLTVTDEVRRSLTVTPPGRLIERSLTAVAGVGDCADGCRRSLQPSWSPSEVTVPNSQLAFCTVTGDLLGSSAHNLESLVRMPTGCGEQNLATLAPAVSLFSYLNVTKAAVPQEIRAKALEAMRIGYQRQLTYRRRDGAFSAFGDADAAGSVWLTAFTLSVFVRAAKFIPVGSIAEFKTSGEFLLRQQQINGRFAEPMGSTVFDSSLQGSARSSSLSTDAFVCVSLIDVLEYCSVDSRNDERILARLRQGVDKCLMYLIEAVNENTDDEGDVELLKPLDWALTAYTLRRAKKSNSLNGLNSADLSSALAKAREALTSLAVEVPEGVTWRRRTSWGSQRDSVEATAYALMEQTLGEEEPDVRVLRWLVLRRDAAGGFGTTQATVVGVRALAEFAERFEVSLSEEMNLRVSVTWQKPASSEQPTEQFSLTQQNRLLLRSAALASGDVVTGGHANVSVEGDGLALLTLVLRYHVSDSESYKLSLNKWLGNSSLAIRLAESNPVASDEVNGTFCVKADNSEGMHILTVVNPSGFAASSYSTYGWRSANLRRVDAEGGKIVFYFSSLSPRPTCVFATWRRQAPVLRTQPQLVTLQRYYNPNQKVFGFFAPPELLDAGVCDVCPDCPGC